MRESPRLARNSPPVPVHSRYSAPAPLARAPPHSPRSPSGLQPVPHELAGPGRSLLFRFGKVFKGFFVAFLVSDWALGGGKGGGRFRCCFHCTVFARRPPPLFEIPYPTEQPWGCYLFIYHPPPPTPLGLPVLPFWTAPGRREQTVRARGRTRQASEQHPAPQL